MLKYKKFINFNTYIGLILLGWFFFSLLFSRLMSSEYVHVADHAFSAVETGFDITIMIYSWSLYRSAEFGMKRIFLLLFFSYVSCFFTDLNFYIIYIFLKIQTPSVLYDFLYMGPFLAYVLFQLFFWYQICSKFILNDVNKSITFLVFFFITLMATIIFIVTPEWKVSIFSLLGLYQGVSGVLELIVFNIAAMALICSKNKGIYFLASATIILIAANFWEKYLFISQQLSTFDYSELFWFLSIILSVIGLRNLGEKIEVRSLFCSLKGIKSQITFWVFGLCVLSFFLLTLTAYYFNIINKENLVSLPFVIMIYSVIVILFSNYIGNKFEQPFSKLKNDIQQLANSEKDTFNLSQDFIAEEFFFLQKFIADAFKFKNERNKEKKEIADLAMQVAHDIRSPVLAIMMLAKECVEIPESQRNSLRDAANRIEDIANFLLNRCEKNIPNKKIHTTSFLISTAVLSVISEKRIEHKDKKIEFMYDLKSEANFSFVHANIAEFKRMFSNIINNSVDAVDSISGRIDVLVKKEQNSIVVSISDNGKGMSEELIQKISNNEEIISEKADGHGLGLSYARDVLKRCDAEFKVESKIGGGSKIDLIFKLAPTPLWITDEIKVRDDDCVVVLDDDQSIHGAWDELFSSIIKDYPNIKLMHFTSGSECIQYVNACENTEKILLLADYELIAQNLNGLDVIEQTNASRTILVTSHYDSVNIIKRSIMLKTKVLPKVLAASVKRTVSEKLDIEKHELDHVDLVLLEDNKEFAEILAYLYEAKSKKVMIYHSPYDLLEALPGYSKEMKICTDYELNCPINGVDMASFLYKKGYKHLYLATGHQMNQKDLPDYICLLKDKMAIMNL